MGGMALEDKNTKGIDEVTDVTGLCQIGGWYDC